MPLLSEPQEQSELRRKQDRTELCTILHLIRQSFLLGLRVVHLSRERAGLSSDLCKTTTLRVSYSNETLTAPKFEIRSNSNIERDTRWGADIYARERVGLSVDCSGSGISSVARASALADLNFQSMAPRLQSRVRGHGSS